MEQEVNTPYKSNYTLGIIFTISTLLFIICLILARLFPVLLCVAVLGGLLSSVLQYVWFYRSHKNLLAFNTQGLKYSPLWAVIGFIIPILNLFRPYQVAQEIWTASDPDASTVGWKQSKAGVVVILWWVSWYIYGFISFISTGLNAVSSIQTEIANPEDALASLSSTFPISAVIGLSIHLLLTISVIVLTNDRQDEKAENLSLL